MSPKRNGTVFIVLMLALVAFGFGSAASALNLGGDFFKDLMSADFLGLNQKQVTQVDDPNFQPIYLLQKVQMNNTNSSDRNNTSRNDTPSEPDNT